MSEDLKLWRVSTKGGSVVLETLAAAMDEAKQLLEFG